MTDITALPTDPANTAPTLTDLVPAWRTGTGAVAYTITELRYGLQAAVTLPAMTLWANPTSVAGIAPVETPLGAGLAFGGNALLANAQDHLGLALLGAFDPNAQVIVNSAGAPARMSMAQLVAGVIAALPAALPTVRPTGSGVLWNNAGVVEVS